MELLSHIVHFFIILADAVKSCLEAMPGHSPCFLLCGQIPFFTEFGKLNRNVYFLGFFLYNYTIMDIKSILSEGREEEWIEKF